MEGSNPAGTLGDIWGTMLSQATSSGMTREDICEMTVGTIHAIANTTRNAMYPEGQPPIDNMIERATEDFLDSVIQWSESVARQVQHERGLMEAGTDAPDATPDGGS